MGRDDWYRRTTWTESDRAKFWARIGRCRRRSNKAQYLRIQASALKEIGLVDEASELFRRVLTEYPEPIELALVHHQLGNCLLTIGDVDGALNEFRAAVIAERNYPNMRTGAWLAFGRLVAETERRDLYDEFLHYLAENKAARTFDAKLSFPVDRYSLSATLAIINRDRGDLTTAKEFARQALAAANASNSGFRYHPALGLVENTRSALHAKLQELV